MVKHGMNKTTEYTIWEGIKQRCLNSKNKCYYKYGGRGIDVCEKWLKFEGFFEDMGHRPSKDYSIDRINNDLGYSKENCKWSTRSEQNRNIGKKKGSSDYKGVHFRKDTGKYSVSIYHEGKNKYFGCYLDPKEAAIEYDKICWAKFNDKRYLNFPENY
jgi:hypothetical protein